MFDLQSCYHRHNKKYFDGKLPAETVVEFSAQKPQWMAEGTFIPHLINSWDYRRHGPRPKVPTVRIDPKLMEFQVTAEMYLFHAMVHIRGVLGDRRYFTHGPVFQHEMLRLAEAGAFRQIW